MRLLKALLSQTRTIRTIRTEQVAARAYMDNGGRLIAEAEMITRDAVRFRS